MAGRKGEYIAELADEMVKEGYVPSPRIESIVDKRHQSCPYLNDLHLLREFSRLEKEERYLLTFMALAGGARSGLLRITSYVEQNNCNEDTVKAMLAVVDAHLMSTSSTGESLVLYLKMKADYNRYLVDLKTGQQRQEAEQATLMAFKIAQEHAFAELPPTHSFRLGLALNLSAFCFEHLNSLDRACFVAQQAIDEAQAKVEASGKEPRRETSRIMELLRQNLAVWTRMSIESSL
ncbi:14-3-3-like protein [Selaginella moellendorffii]|nr:14-3-3-like protein [Selaginella moellendorffii]|eukprot:XP_002961296.2 14-3-3-like protein [Selaginella moellendorffii]